MDHSYDEHVRCINELCRVCGQLKGVKKGKKNFVKPRLCEPSAGDILIVFGIDIKTDVVDSHPTYICHKCWRKIVHINQKPSAAILNSARQIASSAERLWTPYDSSLAVSDCQSCSHRKNLASGCIKMKHPQKLLNDTHQGITSSTASACTISNNGGETVSFLSSHNACPAQPIVSVANFSFVPDNAQVSSVHCSPHYRYINTSQTITHSNNSPIVIERNYNISDSDITTITDSSTFIYATLNTQTCSEAFTEKSTSTAMNSSFADTFSDKADKDGNDIHDVHISMSTPFSKQTKDSSTSPMIKDLESISVLQTLKKSLNEPLNASEEKLSTHFIKRKLFASPDGSKVRCKTKGQPLVLEKITVPRKQSTHVRTPTKRKRSRILNKIRYRVAGSSDEAIDTQLASELKRVPLVRKRNIIKKSGSKEHIQISKKQSLIIKESLGLSWRQAKRHRTLLGELGVKFESEKASKDLANEIVSDFVKVDMASFADDKGFDFDAAYGRIEDLSTFTLRLLDAYAEANMLTWQQGQLPEKEIWVKIGGDHGKGSMKFTLQIANLARPNAQSNTIVIAIASVKDTHTNIKRFFDRGLAREIERLRILEWQGREIKVFLNGDYDFLCKLLGLSGPQGTYPCIWCLMPRRRMHAALTGPLENRTVGGISERSRAFQESGGDIKQAAKFFNCRFRPFLQIPLDFIAPPYLHILLGVVLKHHKLLEQEAHALDVCISREPDVRLTDLGKLVKKYGSNWSLFLNTQDKIRQFEGCVVLSESPEDIISYTRQLTQTEQSLTDMEHVDLAPRAGPVASSLDGVLNKHKIFPQAYHSRSFVGNHCHKYLQPGVYSHLTRTIIKQTQACTNNPFLSDRAFDIEHKFNRLNNAFRQVHVALSHCKPMTVDAIALSQSAIDTYMTIYRRHFPNKTIPKQHILEHHCIPFLRHCNFGLGLLGEQGTENSHQAIQKLQKRASGIRNEVERLNFTLKSHLLQIAPHLNMSIPSRRRKRTAKNASINSPDP